jgi:hypothetical protein
MELLSSGFSVVRGLTSGIFSRFEVVGGFDESTPSRKLAYAFATCLSMDPASPAMEVRQQVLNELSEYLQTPPPPLDMTIGASFDQYSEDKWHDFFDMVARDLPFLCSVVGETTTTRLSVQAQKARVLRGLVVAKLAEDEVAVTDDLKRVPVMVARRAESCDETAVLRLIVGGSRMSVAHRRASYDTVVHVLCVDTNDAGPGPTWI